MEGNPDATTLDLYLGSMKRALMVVAMGWDYEIPPGTDGPTPE
jgi:hypothetical protein